MKIGKWMLAAGAALGISAQFSTAASATDLMDSMYTTPETGHDWSGFYAGVIGEVSGIIFNVDGFGYEAIGGIAKTFGHNWDNGDVIYGIDKMVIVTPLGQNDDDTSIWKFSFQGMGRIGTEVTDNTMIYGAAGLGWSVTPNLPGDGDTYSTAYAALAAGVEVAMNERLAWRSHAQWSIPFEDGIRTALSEPGVFGILSFGTGLVWYAH